MIVPPPPTPSVDERDARDRNLDSIRAEVAARGLPERALFVAVMTALAESDLRRYSNPVYPLSAEVPNDGAPPEQYAGSTKNSLGLYQQRLQWWGTGSEEDRVRQLMDARASTGLFLDKLVARPGWLEREPWVVAQEVQRSEYDGRTLPDGRVLVFGQNYRDRLAQTERALIGGPRYFTDGGK
jgi:hypothetical protein